MNVSGKNVSFCMVVFLLLVGSVPCYGEGNSRRGGRIYGQYCTPCHGQEGNGRGPRARNEALRPPPRDHTNGFYMNLQSDIRFFKVIKFGGKANNLSHIMPQWKHILSDKQIFDVVAYLRTLAKDPPYEKSGTSNWEKNPYAADELQPQSIPVDKK